MAYMIPLPGTGKLEGITASRIELINMLKVDDSSAL